ncbi:MAG: trehalase family glycosidase [Bryobacteraceae bacterium]
MPRLNQASLLAFASVLSILTVPSCSLSAAEQTPRVRIFRPAGESIAAGPQSASYKQVQRRLAQGWNTWDVNSVTTQVLLPEGLAIHVGLKHNTTRGSDAFLRDALIGRQDAGAEQVVPGPHSWDGNYTDLQISWKGHIWRIRSAQEDRSLVMLATPLPSQTNSTLPPTIVFSVDFLWDLPGMTLRHPGFIETRGASGLVPVYCTCAAAGGASANESFNIPIGGSYFAAAFDEPIGLSTGKRRTLAEIEAVIERRYRAYRQSLDSADTSSQRETAPIVDAIETTLGWDTIYEPTKRRVISPVSRIWSIGRGGYVLFDWDTFFAATLAAIGSRDLAYANAIEILRESTPQGFVPNVARTGGWKSFDRSEPPVGAITVLGLYRKFNERWFLEDTFDPLLRWNRWWSEHRDIQGYLTWGSDGENQPGNADDHSKGTRQGAILESGLDNSPMYDSATYDPQSRLLEFADVGLMSLYIADCEALAEIAAALGKTADAAELRGRGVRYRAKLSTLWDANTGIFLNKDLRTGQFSSRVSPTNFYPMLARSATPAQARIMLDQHLLNPQEFWGEWVIPSIARDDPAFHDQNYWRGRIWGPMNYLVYLGLCNYDDPDVRRQFAQKSYNLFLKEWSEKRHVHENYNAISGTGDDVHNSDRFYHWGALLGYIQYLEESRTTEPPKSGR